jgi:hypothetical protein
MNITDYIFPIIFVAVLGIFVFRFVRNGSVTGALLGGRIADTVGEISLTSSGLASRVLKVQTMEPSLDEKPSVALSIVSKAPLGASVVPIKLTPAQTQELVVLLQRALGNQAR